MLPFSLAIAWPLWRRHRLGLLAVLGYLAAAVISASVLTMTNIDPQHLTGFLGTMTLTLIFPALYLIAVFSFGFDVDLNTRESCFPAGLFRLPVRTEALVGWPIAYGAAATVLLWFITASFILRPWLDLLHVAVPIWWPGALAVAILAWFQAVLWLPVGLPGFRIVLAVVLIVGLIVIAEVTVQGGASQGFVVTLFTCLAAVGWTTGYLGVKQARRGTVPNWGIVFWPVRRLAQCLPRRRRSFAGAQRAQVWFEWRRTGKSLPFLALIVLPFVLLPLLWGKTDVLPTERTLLGALAIPVILAGLAGMTASASHPWVKDYYGVAPFTATLPMSTAQLVGAKLKAAALSTLVTWALLILVVILAVVCTPAIREVAEWRIAGLREYGPVKIVAGIVVAAIALIVSTWKRLVDSLVLGLTGRKWIIHVYLYLSMTMFCGLMVIGAMIYKNRETHETVLAVLPWLLCLWALGRLLFTGWALRRVLQQELVKIKTVRLWLLAWLVLAVGLFGACAWLVPREWLPLHYLVFAVLFIMPMGRLAAIPLALAWNRHR